MRTGAAKTTTIRLLLGLITPTGGTAEIFGLDCRRRAPEVHSRTGYVPGEASLWPTLTGAETLHLLGRVHGAVDSAYRDELIARFDFDPSRKVRAYSKGNRQKLLLIAGLMTRAALLILDEPTNSLDPLMEQAFRESVRRARARGQTVLLSSHILSEVEALCDRVAILRSGRLIEIGTLAGPTALAIRLTLATLLGWAAAVAVLALLMGYIAKQAGSALASSASVRHALARFGEHGGSAAAYLGVTFLMVAALLSFMAAAQATAARAEESAGHLDQLLVRPVTRWPWLGGRTVAAAAAVVAGGLLAGLCAWLGAASQDAGVALPSLLAFRRRDLAGE